MKHILTLAAVAFATPCFGQEACPNVHDINSNGTIDIEDFLSILGLFADVDVDEDGVWDSQDDCLDATACNYVANPTEPCGYHDALGECGGACEGDGDGDGICDDVDTCVGELDECGVCNGPGPTEVVVEDITILYDSVYLPQLEEWYVYEFGADTTFSYECAPFFGGCGDPVSYQGYNYATVLIGDQCWFAENLRSENYENGDVIPSNLNWEQWNNSTSGAVAIYGQGGDVCYSYSPDGDACDVDWSLSEYGRLYNYYAVDDLRGLCPSGWHVPSDNEWVEMIELLGGFAVAGGKLKTTYGYMGDSPGTNESGFNGLASGERQADGNFYGAGGGSNWYSSYSNGPIAKSYGVASHVESVSVVTQVFRVGFSVRCIQDTE